MIFPQILKELLSTAFCTEKSFVPLADKECTVTPVEYNWGSAEE